MGSEVTFKNPEYFYLLIGLAPFITWYVLREKTLYPSYTVSDSTTFQKSGSSFRVPLRHLPFILRCSTISLLIIALARPQSFDSWEDASVNGIDIVIANDVSGSMLANDFEPNRLEVSKEVAAKFIESRPYDRIGLVIFAGESLTQCPLTIDHKNVLQLLSKIESGNMKDGTAIGMGLATAINRLRKSDAKSKIIILLTDGVNNQGTISPKTAAEAALTQDVKVYTIGVGSDRKRVMTPYGPANAELDEEVLKDIAKSTGGKYYRAKDENALEEIYKEIDQLEKTEIDTTKFQNSKEEFHWWVIFALITFGTEQILRNTILRVLA